MLERVRNEENESMKFGSIGGPSHPTVYKRADLKNTVLGPFLT